MTFNDVLARLDSTRTGLWFQKQQVTYQELGDRVCGCIAHFFERGVRPGQRVALTLQTDLEHVVAFLALVGLGAVPMSFKPARSGGDEQLAQTFERFGVTWIYGRNLAWDPNARSTDRGAVAHVSPDASAFVQFSSGSLGDPKPVPVRHESLMHNLAAIVALDGRTPGSCGYNFLPLAHDMGLVGGLLSNLLLQNDLHLQPTSAFFRAPSRVFAEQRVEVVAMPDFALRALVRDLARRDRADLFSNLKAVYCGAEPIRRDTIASFVDVAAPCGLDPRALVFAYGMAEATLVVTARRFDSLASAFHEASYGRYVANVGRAIDATEVRVTSDGGIFVRGPGVRLSYLDGAPLADGWHDTEDTGWMQDGELRVCGRTKDMMIINGENIFPGDIEDYAACAPGVRECVVMVDDDDRFYLFVAPTPNLDLQALSYGITRRFGAKPAGIALGARNDILRTTAGKPMRQAMLKRLREQQVL